MGLPNIGRFEVADGSTLLLEEIGKLSLDMQAKLLRVLETGKFERLGSPMKKPGIPPGRGELNPPE